MISSGFDCNITFWDLEKFFPHRTINLNEVAKKNISGSLLSPPLIYSVTSHNDRILVSCETGHIFAFSTKDLKKVGIHFFIGLI